MAGDPWAALAEEIEALATAVLKGDVASLKIDAFDALAMRARDAGAPPPGIRPALARNMGLISALMAGVLSAGRPVRKGAPRYGDDYLPAVVNRWI